MIFVYNFMQCILLVLTFPFLLLLVLIKEKYRGRILARLGFGLPRTIAGRPVSASSRIWIHCLSVGEVTSAIPLIKELRRRLPEAFLVLSVSTATGLKIAQTRIASQVDIVLPGPLDFLPTIHRFLASIRPDIFILVETDFWPNWLAALKQRKIPAILVNGRISRSSYIKYHRFRFFFAPLFRLFSLLCMQTIADAQQMQSLGVPEARLRVLGNLKYDTDTETGSESIFSRPLPNFALPADAPVWVCGSTHPGEEEILLSAFAALRERFPDLVLLIAPRDPGRSHAVAALAEQRGLSAVHRSTGNTGAAAVLVLDTIGELAQCYHLARIAFIGGSLVPCGGHNPLEAAVCGVPCLFGPHMEDFQEIARDLVHCGAATVITSDREIEERAATMLDNLTIHTKMSRAAKELTARNRGVTRRHVERIVNLLGASMEN